MVCGNGRNWQLCVRMCMTAPVVTRPTAYPRSSTQAQEVCQTSYGTITKYCIQCRVLQGNSVDLQLSQAMLPTET